MQNKDADELRGNHAVDQCLCFCFKDSTFPLFPKSEIFQSSSHQCLCSPIVADQVGNPEDRFYRDTPHFLFSVDSCVPGDIVTVSGIVKVNSIDEGIEIV